MGKCSIEFVKMIKNNEFTVAEAYVQNPDFTIPKFIEDLKTKDKYVYLSFNVYAIIA